MGTAKRKYDHREYGASSSSSSWSPASRCDYEVFLSFRSVDTRINITDHLYRALVKREIPTFNHAVNNEMQLQKEIEIQSSLVSIIHRSKIFIVIFSERYATSKWCLLELAKIAERMQECNRGEIIVMPVFYNVSPSDVQNQTGSFEVPFRDLQQRFDWNTIQGWKKALRLVSELRGWHIQGFSGHDEMEFIRVIAETVFSDLGNIEMRSRTIYKETMGFSASRGTTDFGWKTLDGFSFRATYEVSRPFHVFINHRGTDTKNNFAGLLYRELNRLGLNPFLDKRSMMLGEELKKLIETAIRECKVGVAIISPDYCTSDNCLDELAMLMECNKKVIPIFFDTQVSDLTVKNDGNFSDEQMDRFSCALKFAKGRVGIVFNPKEDWPDMIDRVLAAVMHMINRDQEIEEIDYYPPRQLLC